MTMKEEYEIIRYPKIKHINIFIDEVTHRSPHLHADYEICFALDGEATFLGLNSVILAKKGEVVFFDSNSVHSISSGSVPIVGLFIQISNKFLRDYIPEIHNRSYQCANLKTVFQEEELKAWFYHAIGISKSFFLEANDYRVDTFKYVADLLTAIISRVPYVSLSPKDVDSKKKNAERLQRLVHYIDEHYQEAIKLTDLADSEGITPTHLSHLFSNGFGITLQDYINERRFENALYLIKNTEKSITEIAYEAGFSDPKYLTKMCYKHFNCTPIQLRNGERADIAFFNKKDYAISEKIYTPDEAIEYLSRLSID